MAGSQRIEWRRRSPQRALSNLAWYGAIAVPVVACFWLLFRGEPGTLNDGTGNPLAAVPATVTLLAAAGGVAMLIPALRRPTVAASHDALVVRPSLGRTHILPWAGVAEVAVVAPPRLGEQFLLVRLSPGNGHPAADPGWLDRAPLRRLQRSQAGVDWNRYDLAVGMRDFAGDASAQLGALAAFAPDSVSFAGASLAW